MQDEQDTCRICSAPAEPDQPLFYPCKCSGTIRYIHQDCLTTWLAHSKKKTCDVCKYPYSFTKVYSKDMPNRLPLLLLLRRLAQQGFLTVVFCIRACLVGTIWLAFLPWATIMTWRMYFAMGETTAWWISSYPRTEGLQRHTLVPSNTTSASAYANSTFVSNNETTPFRHILLNHPSFRNLSADILSGQIIASVIVLGFVAVFLLREWISQNARPGVFDDAEAPPGGDVPPLLPADPDAPAVAPQPPALPPAPPLDHPALPGQNTGVNHMPSTPDIRHGEKRKVRRIDVEISDGAERTSKGKEPSYADKGANGTPKRRHSWDVPPSPHSSPVPSGSRLALSPEQTQFTFTLPSASHGTSTAEERTGRIDDEVTEPERMTSSPSSPMRRPPLPVFTLPSSPSPPSSLRSRTQTPLASPSLATYRAPEEFESFEAGPSNHLGYFQNGWPPADDDETLVGDLEDDHHHYFREPIQEMADTVGVRRATQHLLQTGNTEADPDLPSPESIPLANEDEGMGSMASDGIPVPAELEVKSAISGLESFAWSDPEDEAGDDDDENGVIPFDGEVDVDEHPLPIRPPPEVALVRQEQLQQRQEQDILDQEEMDAAMEDDMDGALEAIGLRGPLHGVLQNAGLMIFVLDITIAFLVWLPFTMGKSIALLALNPRRSMQLLHLPLRAIRFATDPVVDLAFYLFARTVVPPFIRLGESIANVGTSILTASLGEKISSRLIHFSVEMSTRSVQIANTTWEYVSPYLIPTPEATISTEATSSLMARLLATDSVFFSLAEPYFAPVGHAVRVHSADATDTWIRLAVGSGTSSRLFAIALGYAVDALLLALYLNVLTVGSVRNAGRAVRNAVRQQLLVVKVAGFIVVELVVFPLGCGVMLDICTVWLFPQGSFRSRAAFLMFAPLTSAFYHWVLGTMFMYQFAVLLAGCRSVMRSGAMWFIKDPQDQNFHPIRDILERPTFVQIRKLLLSALMYGLVVLCGVATVSGLLRVFSKTIMPFRWKIREPLSEIPVDLLFLHTALPYTFHYFRPKKFIQNVGTKFWRFFSHQLRLTSYMFGERHASEEYTPSHWSWRQLFVQRGIEMDDSEAHHDGTLRRVPNNDNVALVKHEPATIEVDAEGHPLTADDDRLMALQNAEAEKMKRNVKEDYIIVYIPPNIRYRIVAFIFCMWVVGSLGLAWALAGPILIGRGFFRLFVSYPVHDGYSFLGGFYLLWTCWLGAVSIDRMDRRRQRRGGDEPRARFPLYLAKRSFLWMAQVAYMGFFLGCVIPTLVALVIELYIILPARMSMNADVEPRIRIVDMWALGVVYTKIALRAHRLQADGRIGRGIEHIRRAGWTHPDPFKATKDVIAPLTAGLLGMILVPPIVLFGLRHFLPVGVDDNFLFLHLYPSIFTAAGCAHGVTALSSLVGTWSQSVRDKEFLVEMRLQNLEQDLAKEKEEGTSGTASPIGDADQDADSDVIEDNEIIVGE